MIVLATAVVALAFQGQSFYETTFTRPTGTNGWEEYLMAADIVRHPQAARVLSGAERPSLEFDRRLARNFKRACDLVRAGNAKPIQYPWKLEPYSADEFPVYAGLREVAKLMAIEARVNFADGRPEAGARSIRDCLLFGRRIAGKTVIGGLVSVAMQAVAMRALNENLHKLTVSGANLLAADFDRAGSEKSVLEDAYFAELEHTRKNIVDFILHPDAISDEFPPEIANLSPAEVEAAAAAARAEIDVMRRSLREMLRKEERFWSRPELTSNNQPAGYALQVVLIAPTFPMARNLTQLRLAAVHCRVMAYKRMHGFFPRKIADLNAREAVYDRASGGPFFYGPLSSQSYILYNPGNAETGRVDLVYSRYQD